ncbi:MAG: ribosomal protein S18-alanine N-acetyltransferase [Firmicutes bacterium]|nr:ribosomal protein S18-alanine N-acetyltransferase [Bacillota bacterium]
MELSIRRATENDLKAITELEKECFPYDPWSYESFYNEIVENEDKTIYLAAEGDNKLCGYMGIWEILDEGHITNVAVAPSCRRNHIGEALIEEILRITTEDGIKRWTLEVRVDNEPAIRLYEKMGFGKAGVRRKYYAYDGTDALIMWKGCEE